MNQVETDVRHARATISPVYTTKNSTHSLQIQGLKSITKIFCQHTSILLSVFLFVPSKAINFSSRKKKKG